MQRYLILIHNKSTYDKLSIRKLQNVQDTMVNNFGIHNKLVHTNSSQSILIGTQYFAQDFSKHLFETCKQNNRSENTIILNVLNDVFKDLLEMENIQCSIEDITGEVNMNKYQNIIGYVYLGSENIIVYDSISLKNGDLCIFQESKDIRPQEANVSL